MSRPFGCRLDDTTMLPGDRPGDKVIGIARRTPTAGVEVRLRTMIGGRHPERHVLITPVFCDDAGRWREQMPGKDQRKGLSIRGAMLVELIEILALAQKVLDEEAAAIVSRRTAA